MLQYWHQFLVRSSQAICRISWSRSAHLVGDEHEILAFYLRARQELYEIKWSVSIMKYKPRMTTVPSTTSPVKLKNLLLAEIVRSKFCTREVDVSQLRSPIAPGQRDGSSYQRKGDSKLAWYTLYPIGAAIFSMNIFFIRCIQKNNHVIFAIDVDVTEVNNLERNFSRQESFRVCRSRFWE